MLISETTCDFELFAGVEHAAEVGEQLAVYFEAARGAFSHNTERALRADVEIFASWCRQRVLAALPASAATVVAFIDDMASVKAPATVRRYVSSIATLHRALRQTNPLQNALIRFALQRMHRLRGRRQAQVQGLTWPLRNRLLEAAGDRLIDVRNRALLAVATTHCCGDPSWCRCKCLIYWWKSMAPRPCWCGRARPIRTDEARCSISRATP